MFKKRIRVMKDAVVEIDKTYLTVTCIGYLLIFWIMDLAAMNFVGVSVFPWTHFVTHIINFLGRIF